MLARFLCEASALTLRAVSKLYNEFLYSIYIEVIITLKIE